jgi:methylmalonyl-CoA/ethylmalonyl-CoA epimerase
MREPVLGETLQLGIVVRDLEATMRRYVDDYGIGPWEVYEFSADSAEDFREYGQPAERSWRLAVATIGQVQGELIEPLAEESV